MQEEKWCVFQRFRVRESWRGRVLTERGELFANLATAHMRLMEGGAYALGPFQIEEADSEGDSDPGSGWLCMTWQFDDRDAAAEFFTLWSDPALLECVDVKFIQGHKHDPLGGLPGF